MAAEAEQPFTLEHRAAGPRTQIVAAGGAVGLQEARRLERMVLEGVSRGLVRVVLDLTAVTAIGPGLLGVLLRVRRGVSRIGGRVALVVDGPPASELVHTTLLARLIDVAPERVGALRLVGALGPDEDPAA